MIDVKLKIINNSTANETDYDLSELPNLNQMYEWTWHNFLAYLINYIPPKDKIYEGKKKFKIEITDSIEQLDDNQVHGLVLDNLTKEEVLDCVRYIKNYEPNVEYNKNPRLRKTKKDV